MKEAKLIIVIMTLTLLSCQNKVNKISDKLIGQWVIEEFYHNNEDLKYAYYVNVLSFKEGSLVLPKPRDSSVTTANSNWELLHKDNQKVFIRLSSPDSSFDELYSIDFFKNHDRKLLGLKLESSSTILILYKVRQNFHLDGHDWEKE